ncbi:hypothetical protein KO528_07450 [Saccharophagus degradans]|uniref:hypothetical protein n=1 Tax=Saccharophagus degradans TaxID=86304 RepID=UPI001C086AC7|nr:hypothetical protein [Saccharophagus degradans]MBU2985181.1 hypothetical protein [Saccharophagus degradans]
MIRESFQGFLNWISGGALTGAMALLLFAPTLEVEHKKFQVISILFIALSVPFLGCSLALYKEMSWNNKSTKKSDSRLALLSVIGCLSFYVGFGFLVLSINIVLGVVFGLATLLATYIYKEGSNGLN